MIILETASLTKVTLNKEINDTKKLCRMNLSYFEHFFKFWHWFLERLFYANIL